MDPTIDTPANVKTEYFVTIGKGKIKMHPQPKSDREAERMALTMGHNSPTIRLIREVTYQWR